MELVCREDVALPYHDGQVVLELVAPVAEVFLEEGTAHQILLETGVLLADRVLQLLVDLTGDGVFVRIRQHDDDLLVVGVQEVVDYL